MLLHSKDFALIVTIAFAIITPVALYFREEWLQQFANRIQLEGWMFALSGVISFAIAISQLVTRLFLQQEKIRAHAMRGD